MQVAAVFLMLDEMQGHNPLVSGGERTFKATVADIAQWAGLPADQTKTEIENYAARGQLKINDGTIDITDINEMHRVVEVYNKLHRNGAR